MSKRHAGLTFSEYSFNPLADIQCAFDANHHCITCRDEALVGRVIAVDHTLTLVQVEIGSQKTLVDIRLVDDVVIGLVLLVHGGVAIQFLCEEEP